MENSIIIFSAIKTTSYAFALALHLHYIGAYYILYYAGIYFYNIVNYIV